MAQDRSIRVRLLADVSAYKQAMSEASKATTKVADDADKGSKEQAKASKEAAKSAKDMADNYAAMGRPLLAVGGAITALGVAALKTGVAYNQLQQSSRAALTTLLGSANAANAQMDRLDEFARTSPFSKQTFITAQQQMLAFGVETQKVIPYLDAINDATAAAGGNSQQLGELAFIMAQISAAGKITGQDLIQFGQRGVNAAELIGSQMGKTGAQIRQDITNGALDADAALDALAAGMSQRFDGAADNVKNTFAGAMDRVAAAWRDLSSELAEPFVGKNGGGIFTGLLNEAADLLRSLQGLPGPVKATAVVLTGLVGAASLLAGGFLVLAPRILATRLALAELAASGSASAVGIQKAGGAMASMARNAGLLLAAYMALKAAGSIAPREQVADVSRFSGAILDLRDNATAGRKALDELFSVEGSGNATIKGMDDALTTLSHNGIVKFLDKVGSGFGVWDSEVGLAKEAVEQYDAAITSMVQSGNLKDAGVGHAEFAARAREAGFSAAEIAEMLPGYTGALKDLDNQSRQAAEGTSALTEEQIELRDAAAKQAETFTGLGKSLDDANVSLAGWFKELEANNAALRKFTENAQTAALRGLDEGLIASLKEAGPEGARRLAQLATASESEISRANAAWRDGQRAIEEYVDLTDDVPRSITTGLSVRGAKDAIDTFKRIRDSIMNIPTYRGVRVQAIGGGGGRSLSEADGGVVDYYAAGGIRENHVAQIAPAGSWRVWGEPETGGEAYIPLAPAKRARSLDIWAETGTRLGVPGFANGAVIHQSNSTVYGGSAPAASLSLPDQFAIQITNWATGEGRMVAIADRRIESREYENAAPAGAYGGS